MRNAHLGKPISDEAKAKLSKILSTRIFTPEHRARISASQRGRVFSDETRERMSAWQRGIKWSEERKAKHRETFKSPEIRLKISISQKKRYQKKKEE